MESSTPGTNSLPEGQRVYGAYPLQQYFTILAMPREFCVDDVALGMVAKPHTAAECLFLGLFGSRMRLFEWILESRSNLRGCNRVTLDFLALIFLFSAFANQTGNSLIGASVAKFQRIKFGKSTEAEQSQGVALL